MPQKSAKRTFICHFCEIRFVRVSNKLISFCSEECRSKSVSRDARDAKGEPIIGEEAVNIPLVKGGPYATVDRSDWDSIPQLRDLNWNLLIVKRENKEYNYAYAGLPSKTVDGKRKRKNIFMHRLITGASEDQHVDHGDFDGLNNRRYNIESCTPSQNNMRSRIDKEEGNTSKYRGVSWLPTRQYWRVYVSGKYVGSSRSEDEAARIYNKFALEKFGKFAILNDVPGSPEPVPVNKKRYNSKGNTSKYIGVSLDKRSGHFVVYCKDKRIGVSVSESIAALMYNQAAIEAFGPSAVLNTIDEDSP